MEKFRDFKAPIGNTRMQDASSSSADLRRSKRNKFNLDVYAAVHGSSKKSRLGALTVETDGGSNSTSSSNHQSPVAGAGSKTPEETEVAETSKNETPTEEGLGRRKRRSVMPYRDFGYIYPDDNDDDDDDDRCGLVGVYRCLKCPARYETRPGLSNHTKLHGGDEKRKFACELCDFSSLTVKVQRKHARVHKLYGVISAQPSPAIAQTGGTSSEVYPAAPDLTMEEDGFDVDDSREDHSSSPAPPILMPELASEQFTATTTSPPPLLSVALAIAPAKTSLSKKQESAPNQPKKRPQSTSAKSKRCTQCPYKASSASRLARHAVGHRKTFGYLCPAEKCFFKSMSPGFLKRHVDLHNDDKLPWPPVFVGQKPGSAKNEHMLKRRPLALIRTFKNLPSGFACNIVDCNFVTPSRTLLVTHKIRKHKANTLVNKRFICRECGARHATYLDLSKHKKLRHTVKSSRYKRLFYLKELVGDPFVGRYSDEKAGDVVVKEEKVDFDESFDSVVMPSSSTESSGDAVTYTCKHCPYKAINANRVERHETKHFVKSEFECKYCSFSCRGADMLLQHERLHTDHEGETSTPSTPKLKSSSSSSSAFSTPVKIEVEEPSSKIDLFKSEPQSMLLKEAMKKWYGKPKKPRKNSGVDDNFIEYFDKEVNERRYRCIDCPYASKYKGDVKVHKSRHGTNHEFKCTQCTYSTQRPVSLREHLKLHVAFNVQMANVRVKKIVVNRGQYIGERRGVGKNRIYCCNKCPYVTSTLCSLWRHARQHKVHPNMFVCSACDYSSIVKSRMDDHVIVHSANGDGNAFVKRVNDGSSMSMNSRESTKQSSPTSSTGSNEEQRVRTSRLDVKPSQSPPVTRPPSERSTRGTKKNYYQMVNPDEKYGRTNGETSNSTIAIPSSSSIPFSARESRSFDSNAKLNVREESKGFDEDADLTHYAIREYLNRERNAKVVTTEKDKTGEYEITEFNCPDCPYVESDEILFKLHRDMHYNNGEPRPYACCECNYSVYTPEALAHHLKLHAPLGLDSVDGPSQTISIRKRQAFTRRTETIPEGTPCFECPTAGCGYKTLDIGAFHEHRQDHVRALTAKLSNVMKREKQPSSKQLYTRAKLETSANPIKGYMCTICLFRCQTQNSFIKHCDHHGWKAIYQCRVCDYSSNTKQVVDYHEANHHIAHEISLATSKVMATFSVVDNKLQPSKLPGVEPPTQEERIHIVGGEFQCSQCDFVTYHPPELATHISNNHATDEAAKEEASYLKMGFFQPASLFSTM